MANNHWTNTKVAQLHGKHLYSLGDNLCVREKSGGRKYYVFVYRQRVGDRRGKKVEMTFGPTAKLDIRAAQEWRDNRTRSLQRRSTPTRIRLSNVKPLRRPPARARPSARWQTNTLQGKPTPKIQNVGARDAQTK